MKQQTKRGRPRNPERLELQKRRRFFQLEKNPSTIELLAECHREYRERHGRDATDAEVVRAAMRAYLG